MTHSQDTRKPKAESGHQAETIEAVRRFAHDVVSPLMSVLALSEVLILESPEAAPPFHFPNTVANAPASQVSIELKIYGPNVTITQKDHRLNEDLRRIHAAAEEELTLVRGLNVEIKSSGSK